MKNTLLIAAALLTIGATSAAIAGEPLHSPRAKENQIQVVRADARMLGGRADRSAVVVTSPRHAEQLNSLRKVKGSRQIVTSYHGPVGTRFLSPRAAGQLSIREFHGAQLK